MLEVETGLFLAVEEWSSSPSMSARLPTAVLERFLNYHRSSRSSQVPICSCVAHLSSFLLSSCVLLNVLPPFVICVKFSSCFPHCLDEFSSCDIFSLSLPLSVVVLSTFVLFLNYSIFFRSFFFCLSLCLLSLFYWLAKEIPSISHGASGLSWLNLGCCCCCCCCCCYCYFYFYVWTVCILDST